MYFFGLFTAVRVYRDSGGLLFGFDQVYGGGGALLGFDCEGWLFCLGVVCGVFAPFDNGLFWLSGASVKPVLILVL